MIHGDYADYVAKSGIDSGQYELWHAIWSALDSVNLYALDWTLGRHRALLEHLIPMTFLSNHDVTRVASQIGDRPPDPRCGPARFPPRGAERLLRRRVRPAAPRSSGPVVTTPSGPSCQ